MLFLRYDRQLEIMKRREIEMIFNLRIPRRDVNGNEFNQKMEAPLEYKNLLCLPDDVSIYDTVDALDLASAVMHGVIADIEAEPIPTAEEADLLSCGFTLREAKEEFVREQKCRDLFAMIMPQIYALFDNEEIADEAVNGMVEYLTLEYDGHILIKES